MKLVHIKIKDFRSFSGEHGFDFATGVNYVVGPNNCGKSNLVRALALALDTSTQYEPDRDRPARDGIGARKTRITLSFKVGNSSPEQTLLKRAQEYEKAIHSARGGRTSITYADDKEIKLVTTFGTDGTRHVSFQARGSGARALPIDSDEHRKLEQQFRSVVRFGVIHSGEDLESVLQGQFRQILQLVIRDHLKEELEQAEEARRTYLQSLQTALLEPLRSKVQERVGSLFPEITVASLVPSVPTVQETLSLVDIQLGDDKTTTGLTDKGTGLRGAVALSLLQYLAEQSRRSLVMAVEEPEAFLHPGAQDAIRGHLEELASQTDVSLLITTHSPYVVSRRSDAMVTELRKTVDGSTVKGGVSTSDHETMADLLGPLFRDAGLAQVLDRVLEIPDAASVVVVTEGYTDGLFIKQVCEAVGREDLLKSIYFKPANSAANVVTHAILTKAATGLPVIALFDHDEQGKAAMDRLKRFNWSTKGGILSLGSWPDRACKQDQHQVEIEDLLPAKAVDGLVQRMGAKQAVDATRRCGSVVHRELSVAWKERAIAELPSHLPSTDPGGIGWLVEEILRRAEIMRRSMENDREHRSA